METLMTILKYTETSASDAVGNAILTDACVVVEVSGVTDNAADL